MYCMVKSEYSYLIPDRVLPLFRALNDFLATFYLVTWHLIRPSAVCDGTIGPALMHEDIVQGTSNKISFALPPHQTG